MVAGSLLKRPAAQGSRAVAFSLGSLLVAAAISFSGCKGKEARSDELAAAALELGRSGSIAGAVAKFDEALELHPTNLKALYNSGIALLGAGRGEEAAGRFARFVELRPDDPLGHFHLARASLRAGDREGAMASLKRAVEAGFDDLAEWRVARDLGALAGDFRFTQLDLLVAQRAGERLEAPGGGQGYGGRPVPHAPFPGIGIQKACDPGSAMLDGGAVAGAQTACE